MKFLETQPVRDQNVKKRDVLESVMFLIRPLRRVRKIMVWVRHVRRIKVSLDSDI